MSWASLDNLVVPEVRVLRSFKTGYFRVISDRSFRLPSFSFTGHDERGKRVLQMYFEDLLTVYTNLPCQNSSSPVSFSHSQVSFRI